MARTLIIRTAGTNCDIELARAFELAGSTVDVLHLDRVIADQECIDRCDILAFPGGFSYGDDVASGRIFAMRVRRHLYSALRRAVQRGTPIIGVCNGFQVLVQVGLLPGPPADSDWPLANPPPQTTALTFNSGGRFIDKWLPVKMEPGSPCLWTRGLDDMAHGQEDDLLRLPIAHGEGRFVTDSEDTLRGLEEGNQVALRYVENANGSANDIAGICDSTGRIFGLMPHPERYLEWLHHPYWTRLPNQVRRGDTPGLRFFRNAVEAAVAVR